MSTVTFIITAVALWVVAKIIAGGSLLPIDIEFAITGRWSQPITGAWFRYIEINDNHTRNRNGDAIAYRSLHGVSASFQFLWFKATIFLVPVMYPVVKKPEIPDAAVSAFIKKVQEENKKEVETTYKQINSENSIDNLRSMCRLYYGQVKDMEATVEGLMKNQKIESNAKE